MARTIWAASGDFGKSFHGSPNSVSYGYVRFPTWRSGLSDSDRSTTEFLVTEPIHRSAPTLFYLDLTYSKSLPIERRSRARGGTFY